MLIKHLCQFYVFLRMGTQTTPQHNTVANTHNRSACTRNNKTKHSQCTCSQRQHKQTTLHTHTNKQTNTHSRKHTNRNSWHPWQLTLQSARSLQWECVFNLWCVREESACYNLSVRHTKREKDKASKQEKQKQSITASKRNKSKA